MSVLLREAIGDSIRRARTERRRTLRDVSHAARVSLGYLSEIERGRKEPSSELLASICAALAMSLPDLLDDAADTLRPSGPAAPGRRRPGAALRGRRGAGPGHRRRRRGRHRRRGRPVHRVRDVDGLRLGEARASATDPTLPPDALAGADDTDLDGVLGGLAAGDLSDQAPVPGTVSLIARLPLTGAGGRPVRVAA